MGDFRVTGSTRAYVILFCALIKAVTSTGLGKCPRYPELNNFSMEKMSGKWYEVERSFYLMEISASCTELHLELTPRGYMLITVNTVNRWTGGIRTSYGIGIPSHNGSSVFRYKANNRMPYLIGNMLPGAGQYHILFTDYNTYAIIWSCHSINVAHSDRMWILGRSREIAAEIRAEIYAILEELKLDPDRLIISKNNNCSDIADNLAENI